ncbi:PREDICTED: threonine dehydratase, mitochondrial-like [Vollenhovia emeryi]|uniref:threonine dehydratase, mitochondrial-like n=1 Tax=Vollenhovia emeryi TaxID=411798 RepID=UPI0005F53ECA|nr:PREDICTED: threonine dehydratase, mitochondrial-like [Vollenhovia emeryi]
MNRDNIGTEVKKRATPEDDSMTFSYTVARPFDRREKNTSKWTVVEKGYDKSSPDRQLEISYQSIISAASLLKCYLLETPCNPSVRLLRKEGFDIYLKKELMQITDSIKARGVVYTLLQLSEKHKRKGVITISTGNLAVVLCHYGRKFRIPVTVVLPVSTSRQNVACCKQYENPQTTVLNMGKNMVEAHIIALNIAKVQGLFYLDGYYLFLVKF